MKFEILRGTGVTLHRQIKELVIQGIGLGEFPPNSKLPPARELAQKLGVNVNTVTRVYQSLRDEGLVRIVQGSGVYVTPYGTSAVSDGIREQVFTELDALIEKAVNSGLAKKELTSQIDGLYREKKAKQRSLRIGFTECNEAQTYGFARDIEERLGVFVTPIVLAELHHYRNKLDLLLTTFFHFQKAREIIDSARVEIFPVIVHNKFETLEMITSITPERRVGFVCRDPESLRLMITYIKSITHLANEVTGCILKDEKGLDSLFANADVIIYMPTCRTEVRRLADKNPQVKLIEDEYEIDESSIETLREKLIRYRVVSPA
jgi:DNA-binding transcriptional regulator YhcF (GntR family)